MSDFHLSSMKHVFCNNSAFCVYSETGRKWIIEECCDHYFTEEGSKEEIIAKFQEIIEWLKSI